MAVACRIKAVFICGYLLFVLGGACTKEGRVETDLPEEEAVVQLSVPEDGTIKKSLVFFYRDLGTTDTLAFIREIDGPSKEFDTYTFWLPVGNYRMVLIGNGERDHIRLGHPATRENTMLIYEDGTEPPDLYYGSIFMSVGEKTQGGSGMIMLTARIALKIQNVPASVNQIDVDLENTASGVYLNLETWGKPTQPSIIRSLYDVEAGSSPVINLKSLRSSDGDSSFLEVRCYSAADHILFRGRSAPFWLGGSENIQISCGFATGSAGTFLSSCGDSSFFLYPVKEK